MKRSVLIRQSVPAPARIITLRGGTRVLYVSLCSDGKGKGRGKEEEEGDVLKQLIRNSSMRSIILTVFCLLACLFSQPRL